MRFYPLSIAFLIIGVLFLSQCGKAPPTPPSYVVEVSPPQPAFSKQRSPENKELKGLSINRSLLIPPGRHGRWKTRRLQPRYITIHSTQNTARSANAAMHATALFHGRLKGRSNSLGYLTWHYTVDQRSIYQHLPDTEQGQHADYEGPGNRSSIGIEMCENQGSNRQQTIDHTARLTAKLCNKYRIPTSRVVPHQHWTRIRYRDGKKLGNKNCPHFLLDHGKPGAKWSQFLKLVDSYR